MGAVVAAARGENLPQPPREKYLWYRVLPGETISRIVARLGLCSMKNQGCEKVIQKVVDLNPAEVHSAANQVYQYSQLVLPITSLPAQVENYRATLGREIVRVTESNKDSLAFDQRQVTRKLASVQPEKIEKPVAPQPVAVTKVEDPKERAPAQSILPTPIPESGAYFSLSPYYGLSSLSVTDLTSGTESTLAIHANTGVHLAYIQQWNPKVSSFLGLKLGYVSFTPPASDSQSLEHTSAFLPGIGAGTSIELSPKWNLGVMADYQYEVFARATSTQSDTIDTVAVPSLGVKLSYDLLQQDPFTLGVSGLVSAKMPASTDSYDVRLGALYGGIIYLRLNKRARWVSQFDAELGVLQRAQSTSLTSQTQTDLSLSLKFYLPVGRNAEGGN